MTIDRFAPSQSCRVIVFGSPNAGSGRGRDQIPRLIERLRQASIDVQLTHEVAHLRQLASGPDSERLIIVAAGGDGTLGLAAATVSAACKTPELRPLMAPMPLGTENLLARHFGHRADAEHVFATIRHGTCYELDAGSANDQTFLIMATCGFDADVVRAMHLTRRGHIRRWHYWRPILRSLRRYQFPPLEVCVDGGSPIACHWAMVFNLPCYGGGLRIEPDAIGNDGQFDLMLFLGGSIPSGLKYASSVWLRRHLTLRDVMRCRGRHIVIRSTDRVPYQLDGDYAGKLPLQIDMHARLIRLLVPGGAVQSG